MRRIKTYGLQEQRRLVKCRVYNDGNSYTFHFPGGYKVYRGTFEGFVKFLQKMKVSDVQTAPKSVRQTTYKKIATEITTGTDNEVWIWNTVLDKLPNMVQENV